MSLFKNYQDSSKEAAFAILKGSVAKVDSLQASFNGIYSFASLSDASAQFAAPGVTPTNETVSKGISITKDALSSISQDAQSLENFLHLHIPKMEDGNNFGVTVQLAMLKQMTDMQESIGKLVEELSGYESARAAVLEKLDLPSASSTTTKSTSVSTTDGKKEDKTSESTEEKKSTADTGPLNECRVKALVAVDSLYYFKSQRAFQSVLALYVGALDFMDKNTEKLEKPKGSGGAHAGYSSMY